MGGTGNAPAADGGEQGYDFGRRKLLVGGLLASLAAAYGTITTFALQFIFPKREPGLRQLIFIGFAREIEPGESKAVPLPSGDQLLVSNTGSIHPATGIPYIGFSNQCPHLGCKVHWESQNRRFVCPCHQGVFTPDGVAIAGPPAQANQKLRSYPIEIKGDALYVVVEEA